MLANFWFSKIYFSDSADSLLSRISQGKRIFKENHLNLFIRGPDTAFTLNNVSCKNINPPPPNTTLNESQWSLFFDYPHCPQDWGRQDTLIILKLQQCHKRNIFSNYKGQIFGLPTCCDRPALMKTYLRMDLFSSIFSIRDACRVSRTEQVGQIIQSECSIGLLIYSHTFQYLLNNITKSMYRE